jgi:spore coat polysaccharide biosynthesis protein SpsF
MPKTIACIIARTVSTRLPLKVLRKVTPDYSMLDFIIQRTKMLQNIDGIYLCTSDVNVDEILEDVASANGIKIYRGGADDVLERIISVGELENADNLIRITGDNVFGNYEYVDMLITGHNENNLEYSRLIGVPFGVSPEILNLAALKKCYISIDPLLSEYLTVFMFNPVLYRCGVARVNGLRDSSDYTLTVDTPNDLARTKAILSFFPQKDKLKISLSEIIDIVDRNAIPNSKVDKESNVKLPSKVVSFVDYVDDLAYRAQQSFQFNIQ